MHRLSGSSSRSPWWLARAHDVSRGSLGLGSVSSGLFHRIFAGSRRVPRGVTALSDASASLPGQGLVSSLGLLVSETRPFRPLVCLAAASGWLRCSRSRAYLAVGSASGRTSGRVMAPGRARSSADLRPSLDSVVACVPPSSLPRRCRGCGGWGFPARFLRLRVRLSLWGFGRAESLRCFDLVRGSAPSFAGAGSEGA